LQKQYQKDGDIDPDMDDCEKANERLLFYLPDVFDLGQRHQHGAIGGVGCPQVSQEPQDHRADRQAVGDFDGFEILSGGSVEDFFR